MSQKKKPLVAYNFMTDWVVNKTVPSVLSSVVYPAYNHLPVATLTKRSCAVRDYQRFVVWNQSSTAPANVAAICTSDF